MLTSNQELRELRCELAEEVERLQVRILLGNEDTDATLGPRLQELRHHQRVLDAMLRARRQEEKRRVVNLIRWRTGHDRLAADFDNFTPMRDACAG
jgi:hypothetical protein